MATRSPDGSPRREGENCVARPEAARHGPADSVAVLHPATDLSFGGRIALGLLLVLGVVLAYQPAWNAGFIWDDDYHLTQNPCVVGPLGFKAIWTSSAAVYYPLVLASFWLQHAIWGLRPLPYHLVTLALHAGCAILLWRVLERLKVRGAWLGAGLWALHPVQAESVAWITELKNTQSCLFYLLAILCFLRWRTAGASDRSGRAYGLGLLCALLAILSKTSTVMLPVVLGLCWWWLDGRWRWHNTLKLAPFLLISGLAAAWTIREQEFHSGALGADWAQTWTERLIIAGNDVWFYLAKLFWPHPLIFIYPRWSVHASRVAEYVPAAAALVLLAVLWRNRQGWTRPFLFAYAYFLVSLFPVLGFFNVYFFRYSFVADHFQYLASAGPLALVAAGISTAGERRGAWNARVKAALRGAILIVLGGLTWQQTEMYRDLQTLWRATLSRNPDAVIAHNNLGLALYEKDQLDEATAHFQTALRIRPDFADAHNSLGLVLLRQGHANEAAAQFRQALTLLPDFAVAENNLGNSLGQLGNIDDANRCFRKAIELNPHFALAHYNLANSLSQQSLAHEAIIHYQKALEIQPSYPEAWYNLGLAFHQAGFENDAIASLERAVALRPEFADAQNNLGNLLLQNGRVDGAILHYRKAALTAPTNAAALINLGQALLQQGQWAEAISSFEQALAIAPTAAAPHTLLGQALAREGLPRDAVKHYQAALALQPTNVLALNNLAWIWATSSDAGARDGRRAVALAQQAAELSGETNAAILGTLAAAYAEAGRFNEALATAAKALAVAESSADHGLAKEFRNRLDDYKAGRPHRE